MANAIHVIVPYRHASTWVFDDPRVGLSQEPFVSGIPEMIDTIVEKIPNAEKGFRLLFASAPFPGYQVAKNKTVSGTVSSRPRVIGDVLDRLPLAIGHVVR
jgi:hypothetical protein